MNEVVMKLILLLHIRGHKNQFSRWFSIWSFDISLVNMISMKTALNLNTDDAQRQQNSGIKKMDVAQLLFFHSL